MFVAGTYSFNGGKDFIEERYPRLLREILDIIDFVDAGGLKTKLSREKTMRGRALYNPRALNGVFKAAFKARSWKTVRVPAVYSRDYYAPGYSPSGGGRQGSRRESQPYREMDFVKEKLGVEVQFGKYSFMVYNVAAKMTIFRNLGHIEAGVEIVPVKSFAVEMSTGVSYYEQFVWDLEQRGVSNIDVPVLILGIDQQPKNRP